MFSFFASSRATIASYYIAFILLICSSLVSVYAVPLMEDIGPAAAGYGTLKLAPQDGAGWYAIWAGSVPPYAKKIGEWTVVEGYRFEMGPMMITQTKVKFIGCEFVCNFPNQETACLWVNMLDGFILEDCYIHGVSPTESSHYPLALLGTSNVYIARTIFRYYGNAIQLPSSARNVTIRDCVLRDNHYRMVPEDDNGIHGYGDIDGLTIYNTYSEASETMPTSVGCSALFLDCDNSGLVGYSNTLVANNVFVGGECYAMYGGGGASMTSVGGQEGAGRCSGNNVQFLNNVIATRTYSGTYYPNGAAIGPLHPWSWPSGPNTFRCNSFLDGPNAGMGVKTDGTIGAPDTNCPAPLPWVPLGGSAQTTAPPLTTTTAAPTTTQSPTPTTTISSPSTVQVSTTHATASTQTPTTTKSTTTTTTTTTQRPTTTTTTTPAPSASTTTTESSLTQTDVPTTMGETPVVTTGDSSDQPTTTVNDGNQLPTSQSESGVITTTLSSTSSSTFSPTTTPSSTTKTTTSHSTTTPPAPNNNSSDSAKETKTKSSKVNAKLIVVIVIIVVALFVLAGVAFFIKFRSKQSSSAASRADMGFDLNELYSRQRY